MLHGASVIPSRKDYLGNLEDKMSDPEFLGDTIALLRPDEAYDPVEGFEFVKSEIIDNM